MRNIYFLITGFTAIWCVSASDCDVYGALSCIKSASRSVGSFLEPEPTCDAWYVCLSQHKCTPQEADMPSLHECNAIESCSLESWEAVHNCYTMERNCSDLLECLDYSPCSTLGYWVYNQYCKSGIYGYCHASASIDAKMCVSSKGSQASCSTLQQCLSMDGSNCDVVLKHQLELPDKCRLSTNNEVTDKSGNSSSVLSCIPLTLGILIATVVHAMSTS